MIDSWYYASCVKYRHELFNSHHLLYNVIGNYWFSLLNVLSPNIGAIAALNLMNAFAATGCLFLLYACLLKLGTQMETAFWLSLFCGVSFGFMRYATDAETYILPLLFSLISTYFFIDFKNNRQLFFAGFFATLAILIHQLHIWWALAMFIYLLTQKPFKIKQVLLFGLSFILIPCAYYLAFKQPGNNASTLIQFITGEYSKGNAGLDISLSALLLTLINFIRTFIQVHGQIVSLFHQYFLTGILIIICCLGIIIYAFINNGFKFHLVEKEVSLNYAKLFLVAFSLHILFAFLSSGNAEFMVILPFLIVLSIGSKYRLEKTGWIKSIVLIMLLWNLSSAILPNALLNISKVDKQVWVINRDTNAYFLWKNKPLVENVLTYQNGFNSDIHFISNKSMDKKMLDSLLAFNATVYTDFPNAVSGFSRESLLSDTRTKKILLQFHLEPIDSFQNLYGKNYIYLIQKRAD